MVQMAVYEVVLMIAVRNRLMAAPGAVLVPLGMAPAFVVGCLGRRGMLGIDCNHMLVNMICVGVVQVAFMKVVSMSFVLNSGVSAGRTMLMSMFFVDATGFRHNVSLCSPLWVSPSSYGGCDAVMNRCMTSCVPAVLVCLHLE
jgi:hypothetical protein